MIWKPYTNTIALPKKDGTHSCEIPAPSDYQNIWNNGPKSKSSEDIAQAIQILARNWGVLIKTFQGQTKVSYKENPNDVVTEMDIGIEILFRTWLNHWLPTHKIIGEEGQKDPLKHDDYIWYIDPIDGTSNYTNNKPYVTLHIACIHNHHPFLAYIGLPIFDQWICGYHIQDTAVLKKSVPFKWQKESTHPCIATEYLENQSNEENRFKSLAEKLHFCQIRYKSIGASVLHIMETNGIFYKPAAKLWDVIPPMAILYFSDPYFWDCSITYYPEKDATETVTHSLFSTTPNFIHFLNIQHKDKCRTGLVIAAPLNNQDYIQLIKQNARII